MILIGDKSAAIDAADPAPCLPACARPLHGVDDPGAVSFLGEPMPLPSGRQHSGQDMVATPGCTGTRRASALPLVDRPRNLGLMSGDGVGASAGGDHKVDIRQNACDNTSDDEAGQP